MTDGVNINSQSTLGANASRSLYRSEGVREVQSRARFVEQEQTPQEQAGLKRLNGLLRQGTPLNQEAPRGYYLNINV